MMTTKWRLLSLLLAAGLVAGACGSDDGDDTAAGDDTSSTTATDDGSDTGSTADAGETEAGDGPLAGVCPSPLVIQTDWFPEAEHGALFELVGDDYEIDGDNKLVRGNMVLGDTDQGIDVEVRAGGPAIGSGTVAGEMYTDDSIQIGYATTDSQILRADTPLLSIMAPLERNPQIIYWDPETYPDIESIADLGEANVTVNVFPGGTFAEVFVAMGLWNADQVDPSYDGSPGRFVADGTIAQQGFASAEPWTYKNTVTDFGRDVAYQLFDDAGFRVYSQTLGIKPDDKEALAPCLELLIPVIQQATVDYYGDPAETNALIVEAVTEYDTFWTYSPELADFSVATQLELGLAGNGDDAVVGNMDPERIQTVIDQLIAAEMDVPDGITPDDLYTNEFIDDSIGFAD
ncbi:MAG: ABC transporter substrate-binding protein [Acidimicrobiales bacterium]